MGRGADMIAYSLWWRLLCDSGQMIERSVAFDIGSEDLAQSLGKEFKI